MQEKRVFVLHAFEIYQLDTMIKVLITFKINATGPADNYTALYTITFFTYSKYT